MIAPQMAYWEYCQTYKKPFVAYRLPDSNEDITLILKESSVKSFEDYSEISEETGFIFTPFDTRSNKSYFIKPEEICKNGKGFRADLFLNKEKGENSSTLCEINETKEEYQKQFEKLFSILQNNKLGKVILSKTITFCDYPEDEQTYIFYRLIKQYPKAMVYWVHLPHLGVEWMGATPELLLKKEDNKLRTLALAGTKKPEEEWTEKERKEQQIVTDYIAQQLSDFNPIISKTETISAGDIQHLATYFTIPDNTANFFPILKKLHPTPAICGFPKEKAFEVIQSTERHDRNYYCGILGVLNLGGATEMYANLRCMQLANNSVRIFVGGGLTKDSNLEREWNETERKADTLRKILL